MRTRFHRLLVLTALVIVGLGRVAQADPCDSPAAKALQDDGDRATLWNWGWGATFLVATAGYTGLGLYVDDEDKKFAAYVGAAKAGLGVGKQIVMPLRIYAPKKGCEDLGPQLLDTDAKEAKARGWLAHAMTISVGLGSFALVGFKTDDWLLAAQGALVGTVVGELTIFTSPRQVRLGGHARASVVVIPTIDSDSSGFALIGRF